MALTPVLVWPFITHGDSAIETACCPAQKYGVQETGDVSDGSSLPVPPTRDGVIVLPPDDRINSLRVPQFSSKPNSENVLYLDFDGVVDFQNDDWFGGETVTLAPFSRIEAVFIYDEEGNRIKNESGNSLQEPENPATLYRFDDDEIKLIVQAWMEVTEDFLPFDVNVTTDVNMYNNADPSKRQRCIMTSSDDAGGTSGLNTFGTGSPCFVFNREYSSLGGSITHEFGHTLGLIHDGTEDDPYFDGYGSGETGYKTIMGDVGTSTGRVVWDKGEYPGANNLEDDIQVIADKLGLSSDDYEATHDSATHLLGREGVRNYRIRISDYMRDEVGSFNHLVIYTADLDDEGESVFSNVRLYESGDEENAVEFVFTNENVTDIPVWPLNGSFSVENQGTSVRLTLSHALSVPINYEFTEDTILEFDFAMMEKGALHRIGFHSDADQTFGGSFFHVYGGRKAGVSNAWHHILIIITVLSLIVMV